MAKPEIQGRLLVGQVPFDDSPPDCGHALWPRCQGDTFGRCVLCCGHSHRFSED